MTPAIVFFSYFKWHYFDSLKDAAVIWRDFLFFIYHFFSLKYLVLSFFKPWRRMGEVYGGGLNIYDFLETIIINTILRLVGMLIKIITFVLGLTAEILTFFGGLIFLAFWFFLPLIFVFVFLKGFILLF